MILLRKNFFGTWFAIFFFALFGCGENKSQYDVEQKVSGVTWPTMATFGQWREIWDGESWITALSRNKQELKSSSLLRSLIAENFADSMASKDATLDRVALASQIGSLLETHVTAIANLEKTLPSGAPPLPVFGFAEVRVKNGIRALNNVFQSSGVWRNKLSEFELQQQRDEFMVRWMWDSLERTSGIEFAEPNLDSQIQQESQEDSAQLVERLKAQWNTFLSGVDVAVPAMLKGNTVVVAVVDTGVDNKLDDKGMYLENRLYKNPGEDPFKGAKPFEDDDGNGWVDDYYGVNASISKGGVDNGPAPVPGSNDVGGPGTVCDVDSGTGSTSCGHGSHVAGIIAGGASAGSEFAGVCPLNCKILPIRAAKRCYAVRGTKQVTCPRAGESFTLNPEVHIEVNGGIADSSQIQSLGYILDLTLPDQPGRLVTNVVNLSIGKYFSSRALSLLARRLVANDVLMVAAAGNQNVEVPMFPAAYRDVISVCSTSHDPTDVENETTEPTGSSDRKQGSGPVRGRRLKSRFSNYGDWVDICAPGSNIRSSVPGGGTRLLSGTSQAAPHVAGVAGLLKAIGSSLSALDIRAILLRYSNFDLLYGQLPDGSLANADFAREPYQGVKVFLLGSGILSASNAFYALTDPAKAQTLVSQAEYAINSGDTAQVTSGCVVSSLSADHRLKMLEFWSSLPVLLLCVWIGMRCLRPKSKRPGSI